MLEHGGALRLASQHYGRPLEQWLDVSTGINPLPYPIPSMPSDVWQRLPEDGDGLEEAARQFYGLAPDVALLPLAGSQAAIQTLPKLIPPGRVLMVTPCYAEHRAAWQKAGHELVELSPSQAEQDLEQWADGCDAVLLCQPNNPTGLRWPQERLLALAQRRHEQGRWLVLDEAFMESTPEHSLCPSLGSTFPKRLILRSLGKFFGLAGLRVGFALGAPAIIHALREELGPWTVSGPARYITQHALRDQPWHAATRQRLAQDSQRLAELLRAHGLNPTGGSHLFQYCPHVHAPALFAALAEQGVLVRLFSAPNSALRFGLPGNAAQWQQLERALQNCSCKD